MSDLLRGWVAAILITVSVTASAVPSFARQTGMACAGCHVGGFGPQLTDFGTSFKLNGYTMTKGGDTPPPLAAMLVAGFTHTRQRQSASAMDGHDVSGTPLQPDDNVTLDQVSLFYAGRIADALGAFIQLTYDGVAQRTAIDNVDIRFADSTSRWAGHTVLYGLSLNNNPGVQDPFNTTPAWSFPFVGSAIVSGPSSGTVLDETYGQKALGTVGYAQLDGTWYAELGTYRMLTLRSQAAQGLGAQDRDAGALRAPLYARFAARSTPASGQSFTAGLVLFKAGYQADRAIPDTTHSRDLGIDVNWRWLGEAGSQVTVLGNAIHESPMSTSGTTEYSVTASYYTPRQVGINVQRFGVNSPGGGSRGTRVQVDWTPTGQRPLTGFLDPSVRMGVQATLYGRLDGATGAATSASDSIYLFYWLAF